MPLLPLLSAAPRHRSARLRRGSSVPGLVLILCGLAALLPTSAQATSLETTTTAAASTPMSAPSRTNPLVARPAASAPTTVSSQRITVRARGTWATVTAWQRTPSGWRRIIATRAGRIGSHGLVAGTKRIQGTGTTPTGSYDMTEAFGVGPAPGTRMRYRHVGRCDWWDADRRSKYYNNRVNVCLTKPDFPLTERGRYGSEQLIRHAAIYRWAVVIDFNRPDPVRGRGAGIFLHVNDTRPTTGCVSVPYQTMRAILRWLVPARHPQISIR